VTFETGAVAATERVGITTSAGADRIMAVSTSPVLDSDGNVIQVVEIGQDITERKLAVEEIHRLNSELEQRIADRTAQLTAANQELEAFSYSVSHDLRAPLRSLDGFSKALLEDYAGQLDEQGKQYLTRIQEASRRMGQLINDLLDLSRVTRADFTRQRVDLSALANSITAELKAQSPSRQVEFEIKADMIVHGDENLIKIVLENLLNNACKFTSRREQALIQVGRVEQDGQWNYFVRDNGAGFDMTYANKLFAAFQRLHSEKEFPGTGIGLATVQRIIRRHGGRVWAEGVVDQGATFYFTIMPTG
jgi:light-regulated signal transduction histidine kinase (bacteriophytochrome)